MAGKQEFYTHGHSQPVVAAHAQRSAADSAQFLLAHLTDGMDLLDFGCGPGSITRDLARYVGAAGTVVGIDTNNEALRLAVHTNSGSNVRYVRASVYALPFPDATFDVAYGHQILQHLADPVGALGEIHRVLRPGGLVAVRDADYGSMTHYPHYPELDRWLDLYRRVARYNGGEPDAGRRLREWVSEAGFLEIRATVSSWSYTDRRERREWAQLWSSRIQVDRFGQRVAAVDQAADIPELAAAWLRWAEEPFGWFAFLHGEVLASRKTG